MLKKFHQKIYLILIPFLVISFGLSAQTDTISDIKSHFNQKFGLNDQLYNGKFYYFESQQTNGSPFWGDGKYNNCTVVRGDSYFRGNELMYDLFNDDFVLIFKDRQYALKHIVLQEAFFDTIFINGSTFIKNKFEDIDNRYIELVHDGMIHCYISWSKDRAFKTAGESAGYYFTKAKGKVFLEKNGILTPINSKRDLILLFNPEKRKALRRVLYNNKLKIKKLSEVDLKCIMENIEEDFL